MNDYEKIRRRYKPDHLKVLLIAESPPPPPAVQSSRQFYYSDRLRKDDRLFINTIKAIYPEAAAETETALQADKTAWLNRFKADGFYMIEALDISQPHAVSKQQRQYLIHQSLPKLLSKVKKLATSDTKIILIKSNVFEVTAEPLKRAGFNVLNKAIVDYPGRYNQKAYRHKLAGLLIEN